MFLFAYHVTLEVQSSLGVEQATALKEMPQIVEQWIPNITSPIKKKGISNITIRKHIGKIDNRMLQDTPINADNLVEISFKLNLV